jgi:hypothetical protein
MYDISSLRVNNASKWQMGFDWAFKELRTIFVTPAGSGANDFVDVQPAS